ncbi:Na+/H+ antiporter [Nocardia sp. 2YAB30]|uniref:Na+/H+ antiporter n=1 Tax=Nocardia sp. 2YAB30 TaxID=3233022 RepID=UPI003F95426E
MLGLELIVALGISVLVCTMAGSRYRIASPILLLAAGLLLWFIPALRAVRLSPDVVLLLFLPALLHREALTTSQRSIRQSLRGIVLVSTVLVIVTAAAIAVIAHRLGMPWGPAWVLGAALAPTDATAVAAFARMLPARNMAILRAESLVNDGTALVVYGVAVAVTVGEQRFSLAHVSELFVIAYVGGAVTGAVVAWIALRVRQHLDDRLLINTVILLTPFTAYLIAESIEASGVLAVVLAGLIVSRYAPRGGRADARRQTEDSWTLATFLLNGSLFVLVGLETQSAARGLTSIGMARALAAVVIVAVALLVVRIAFLVVSAYVIRGIDRRPEQKLRRVSNRARVVSGMAGFRGAVSLAAALAVPELLDSGAPFPDRDMIVFVTAGVIVVEMVVQGLLLPAVVRWARLPQNSSAEQELLLAHTVATEAALAALPQTAKDLGADDEVIEQLRAEYLAHLAVLHAEGADDSRPVIRNKQSTELRLALLAHKRAAITVLRAEQRIDDPVFLQFQTALDTEEVRLAPPKIFD